MSTTKYFLGLFLALFVIDAALAQSNPNCTCSTPLSVGTFNILQIPFAPFRDARFNATVDFLQNNPFDILCLQEVFEPNQRGILKSSLKSIYNYTVQPKRVNDTCTSPCNDDDANALLTCFSGNRCLIENGFSALSCLIDNCKDALDAVSDSCSDCIISLDGGLSISGKIEECAGQNRVTVTEVSLGDSDDDDDSEAFDACNYLFDEQSDPLLFSRYEIVQSDVLYFNITPFYSITALYALINVPRIGSVNAFCTHLSANLPFSNNELANLDQVVELTNWIESKTTPDDIVLVMGDFNMGPDTPNVDAVFPNSYWTMVNLGYIDSTYLYDNITGQEYNCTYCANNELTSFDLNQRDEAIDHIFVRQNAELCVQNSGEFATELLVTVPEFNDDDDDATTTTVINLSDHYGVFSNFCPSDQSIGAVAAPFLNAPAYPGDDNNSSSSVLASTGLYVILLIAARFF